MYEVVRKKRLFFVFFFGRILLGAVLLHQLTHCIFYGITFWVNSRQILKNILEELWIIHDIRKIKFFLCICNSLLVKKQTKPINSQHCKNFDNNPNTSLSSLRAFTYCPVVSP